MIIETQFDTYEEKVINTITSMLTTAEFRILESNVNKWNDLYLKFLLQTYTYLCNLITINISVVITRLQEPITIYVDPDILISKVQPLDIIHTISLNMVKNLFSKVTNINIIDNKKNLVEFRLPHVFTKVTDIVVLEDNKLSVFLTEKLLRLYIIAEHASYHYKSFIKFKKCDYNHKLMERNIFSDNPFFHNIITNQPNEKLSKYTEEHISLYREDREIAGTFNNDPRQMFLHNNNDNSNNNIDDDTDTDSELDIAQNE
uniref:Uncharacterized protein n=1 Tax=Faxonius propinquus nudivirus TaxID=3139431 RepID=A0AAU8GBJ2_9VIRU